MSESKALLTLALLLAVCALGAMVARWQLPGMPLTASGRQQYVAGSALIYGALFHVGHGLPIPVAFAVLLFAPVAQMALAHALMQR